MKQVQNPHRHDLFCLPLRRIVRPDEVVEMTDEQAAALGSSFRILGRADAEQEGATPVRTTAKKGAAVAEQTVPPAVETT